MSFISRFISFLLYSNYKEGKEQDAVRKSYKDAFSIAYPATIEYFFVGLVNLIDTIMVSGLGTVAIAAVGLTNQPKFIIIAFILALNIGVTATISRRIGEKDINQANSILKQSIFICLVISLITCTLSWIFARPYLILAGARSDTIELAQTYFRMIIVGTFFHNISLTINAAQRCTGNSRLSMSTNMVGSAVNVVFNYILIHGHFGFPALGVAGAAIATTLGNMITFLLSFRSLFHPSSIFTLKDGSSWIPSKDIIKSLWKVSGSSLGEHFFLRTGFFVFAKIVAGLGTTYFAIHQICMNITNITFSIFEGFSVAAAALTGKNLGAKQPKIAEISVFASQRLSMALATVISLSLVFFRIPFLRLFSKDKLILHLGSHILIMIALSAHALSSSLIYAGALRGAGDTRFLANTALVSTALLRPAISWILCYPLGLGLYGIWIGVILDFYFRSSLNHRRFKKSNWKYIEV